MITTEEADRLRMGLRIAEVRKEKGLTQEQLAEKSGLLRPNLVRIESGRYNVTFDTLARIAQALDSKIDLTERK